MEKLTKDDPETRSADLIAENIERLKELFPDIVTEGPGGAAVNVDVLKSLVGDQTVTDADEKYGLNWHGKRRARQVALTPSTGTLRPCPEESVDWDTTQNLMIEGDNLEVLKLLRKSYAGEVKLIYIDPPYNTGKDFVYPDDFRDSIKNYLEITRQAAEGSKISTNSESNGRFHTDWLSMMYPRLKLACDLLDESGAIFISIDDTEAANLRKLCDEVFGEENFVATFIWQKRTTRENRKVFSFDHDFILCFAKNKPQFQASRNLLPFTEAVRERYSNPDNDPRGPWQSVSLNAQAGPGRRKEQFYTVVTPGGRRVDSPAGRCWIVTEERMTELISDNRVWFGEDGNNVPRLKSFLSEARDGLTPHTLWTADEVGTTDSAKRELTALFDGVCAFDTPKPTELLERIAEITLGASDTALDFFAGSGALGEAVMRLNTQDGGNRRFILVQLQEPIDDALPQASEIRSLGINDLAGVCRSRLQRAGVRMRGEGASSKVDLGFRTFRLASSNILPWESSRDDLEASLFNSVEHLLQDRNEADLLYELLIRRGLDLCVPIETHWVAGKSIYTIGGGVLIACLAQNIAQEEIDPLALGISKLREDLAPAGDTTCVFRDSAFATDVAKTNLAAILNQHGLTNVRSL
jgi:adenine-specific DNA-methyltransferase